MNKLETLTRKLQGLPLFSDTELLSIYTALRGPDFAAPTLKWVLTARIRAFAMEARVVPPTLIDHMDVRTTENLAASLLDEAARQYRVGNWIHYIAHVRLALAAFARHKIRPDEVIQLIDFTESLR